MELKVLAVLLVVIASSYAKFVYQPDVVILTSLPKKSIEGDEASLLERKVIEGLEKPLHERIRRSPEDGKRGSVVVSGSHTKGQFRGPSQSSIRGDYNHNLWRGKNGATIDANAFYQRNRGGGPKQDYGGGISASIPFGKR